MLKQIKQTIMSERGSKAVNAIMLTIIAGLMAGIFTIMVWFLGDFSGFRHDVSRSFDDLKQAQTKHVLDEVQKNAEQDKKIDKNSFGVEENKKDIKELKTMGGF